MIAAAEKTDFKKQMRPFWRASTDAFTVVDVPPLQFVMIDGEGDPNTAPAYVDAVQWLYSVSYTLKFASKAEGRDYGVCPLEGLWWSKDMQDFVTGRKDRWSWTAMIMQPDWITPAMFEAAAKKVAAKLGKRPSSLRLAAFAEGPSVQILHIGPYAAEGPTIARLHEQYLPEHRLRENGNHHEIYFSDPRRTAPEKLKTLIRQPVVSTANG